MKHILVIEDDVYIGNAIEEMLKREGYQVSRAYSGTEAVLVLPRAKPDLVLLDLMLPGVCGEEVLKQIRGIPVIILSARSDIDHKVELLLDGAADYITKPFHQKELLARVSVQLRNASAAADSAKLTFQDLSLDADRHIVAVNAREVKLTRTEYAILKLLMKNPAQVVTKSLLLERISEDTPDCTESSLKTHISHLRAKLRETGSREYIESVWGIGFKMKEE